MHCVALVLVVQVASAQTVPPYLAFPDSGLDDPAAYQGYATRVYRDARHNAFQIYLNSRTGRVVHLWADAANESVGLTVRDSAGRPAAPAWGGVDAVVEASGATRTMAYTLDLPSPVSIGLFLLGSMRVERDFQYAQRDSLPLDSVAFPQSELLELLGNLEQLPPNERERQLAVLGVRTMDVLRGRLEPRITGSTDATQWTVRVEQPSFDGRNQLSLVLAGDLRSTSMALAGWALTVRAHPGERIHLTLRVTTDAPALTPLSRAEIFNDDFNRFYAAVRGDIAHPERLRRLEREVRGMEVLCYGEKLMAGLPNFATYFGRDMLMAQLLLQPVWSPVMPEHVIAAALRKLSPEGAVSHEEALGGQAIREHAGEYNRLIADYRNRLTAGDSAAARGLLARARSVLGRLQAVRENYIMVDDDFQLPVVAARYLADARVSPVRKRRFLLAEQRLARLVANLAYVARQAQPYARDPVALNLVSFPRAPDGRWISASWRDSRAGYGGGRFAMDVNAIWVPRALLAIGTIVDALGRVGFTRAALDSLAPAIRDPALAPLVRDRERLTRAVATWNGAERHFRVALAANEVADRVGAKLRSLPEAERDYWNGVFERSGPMPDTLRFLALSLDGEGRPIPIVSTDPAMLLVLEPLDPARAVELVESIVRPYPIGLFVEDLGPVVANDAYASPDVWDAFRHDAYHSPTVVWGRDVNLLLAGLASQLHSADSGPPAAALALALQRTNDAVERSGLRHAELWSYQITAGRLAASRYGSSSDVQLWSLTDLAVQFLLYRPTP